MRSIIFTLVILSFSAVAAADKRFSASNPILDAHAHDAGTWMVEYRSRHTNMRNLLSGDTELTPEQVLNQGFAITPIDMTMTTHMFSAMYGISENVTGMIMTHYVHKQMSMQNAANEISTMSASGLGDTQLGVVFKPNKKLLVSLLLSLPVGSFEEQQNGNRLPYNMQLGSGSLDLVPSITYSSSLTDFGWGISTSMVLRGNDNEAGYTLGNQFRINTWGMWILTPSWANSFRLDYKWWSEIDGRDATIADTSPAGRAELQAGQRMELGLGMAYTVARRHLLGLELSIPLLQNLEGPQLQTESSLNFKYKILFQE